MMEAFREQNQSIKPWAEWNMEQEITRILKFTHELIDALDITYKLCQIVLEMYTFGAPTKDETEGIAFSCKIRIGSMSIFKF